MSRITKIFDRTIIVEHCDQPELYKDPRVLKTVQDLIAQPDFDQPVPEQQGEARSTIIDSRVGQIAHLPQLQPLMQWIMNTVWSHRSTLGYPTARHLNLGRNWANEMFEGCSGVLHQHYTNVCVFYLRVPENGADMQFEQDGQVEAANAGEGDLLIHEPLIWHSVSEHRSPISRICLVIEFEFVV